MDSEQLTALAQTLKAELIETHISWLLLNDRFVYKIKKPLKFSFLDFSTFEKRKYYCEEEVRLNRRLSPEIYLGVVPVVEKDGEFAFEGVGRVIDHAVKMKRLPQERRMDILLDQGEVTQEHVVRIAHTVADFHQRIEVIDDKRFGSWQIVKRQIDDLANHRDTIEEACGLGDVVDLIVERSDAFIEKNKEMFEERQKEGAIRDCQGDLHSANIFIVDDKPIIFDCIEFNEDFRFIDVASEIAFMYMDLEAMQNDSRDREDSSRDLEAHGREDLAKLFVEEYLNKTRKQSSTFISAIGPMCGQRSQQ
jgi:aminoglycoside phosphotransferase family enzyme